MALEQVPELIVLVRAVGGFSVLVNWMTVHHQPLWLLCAIAKE